MMQSPQELTDQRLEVAREYMKGCERMGMLESLHAGEWLKMRATCKTDRECDRQFDASELGKEMSVLKWKLKGMDKMLSAIAAKIRLYEGEAKNQF